jgi:glyoxylase I family protein
MPACAVRIVILMTNPRKMNPEVEAYLVDLEASLLDASVRDSGRVEELLAEDFVEFGSSGNTYTKIEVISALSQEPARNITARDFKVKQLLPGNALVTYRTYQQEISTLRSSVWQLRAGKWQLVFHQGTIISP